MAEITVLPLDRMRFEVTITEGGSTSIHEVTAKESQVDALCADCSPAQLVEASVRFLLDHEPKESIMRRFDLDVIARFFPDYTSAIVSYL